MNMNTKSTVNEEKSQLVKKQKEKIKKMAVFALMGIICTGSMLLIFAPSEDEKRKQEAQTGFNAEIPMPKNEVIISDKRDAYEQAQMQQKQAERMRSLEDFSSLLGDNSSKQSDDLILPTDANSTLSISQREDISQNRAQSSVHTSTAAYRNINRTLGNFYETPKIDTEKEDLKRQVEELQTQMNESENRKKTVDEQMALMEKSFQMASKYMPTSGTTVNPTPENPAETETKNAVTVASRKTQVAPVGRFIEHTVSALPQEMSDNDILQAFSQPRNIGFLTATAELSKERKNTVFACIHADQTLMDGENVRLRLLEPMQAGKILIRENTILSGFSKIQGERLQITVNSLEYGGNIISVELSVYDTDGQRGIFIPNIKEINAVKETAANMGTNAGTSVSFSSGAGEQFAADMGRSVVQGVSQFFSKKMHEVKVSIKAGYSVFLLPEGNINNLK
jgi:conjugative transposon TraM protein